MVEPGWMYNFKEAESFRHNSTNVYANSEKLCLHADSLHRFKPDVVPELRGESRHQLSPLTKKISVIDTQW